MTSEFMPACGVAVAAAAVVSSAFSEPEPLSSVDRFGAGESHSSLSERGQESPDAHRTMDGNTFECLMQSNCSSTSLFLLALYIYLFLAAVSNIVALYKFFAAWNLIVSQRRFDLSGLKKRRRKMTMKEALQLHVTADNMACTSCCICLSDFYENELVTSCDDGCGKWFHKECLFEWLDQSDACPCCRKNMFTPPKRGFLYEMGAAFGFGASGRW